MLIRAFRPSVLFLAFLGYLGAQDEPARTLALMNQASISFKGLTAEVSKTSYWTASRSSEVEKGAITVKRPRPKEYLFLYAVREPDPQQMEYSGGSGRIYNPKMNSWRELKIDKQYRGVVNEYLLLGFGSSPADLQASYTIKAGQPDAIGGLKTSRIELTPKKPDNTIHLVRAELWISTETGIALQQKLYYPNGDYLLVTYSNMKLRSDIRDADVKLKMPKDAVKEK